MTKKIFTKMKQEQKPILQVLREMEAGDKHSFPISRMSTVKTSCTMFGLQWGKKYSTKVNREKETIEVTRTA